MVSDERRPSVFKYTEIRQMWRFSKLCRHIWGPLLASKLAVQQPSLTSIPLPGSESDIDFLFLKIDADGNLVWDELISDESAVDYGTDVIETSDGGYLITGMFSGGGHGAIPLIKTDGSGQVLWTRNLIEGRGNKVGMRVFPASDGGYMIVGNTDEYRRGFETVLIKTDSEGKVNE